MRALLGILVLVLAGCSTAQGIIGDGKPTVLECNGISKGNIGPYAVNMDCTQFKLKLNVQ